jgi:hypothetical protein
MRIGVKNASARARTAATPMNHATISGPISARPWGAGAVGWHRATRLRTRVPVPVPFQGPAQTYRAQVDASSAAPSADSSATTRGRGRPHRRRRLSVQCFNVVLGAALHMTEHLQHGCSSSSRCVPLGYGETREPGGPGCVLDGAPHPRPTWAVDTPTWTVGTPTGKPTWIIPGIWPTCECCHCCCSWSW